MNILNGERIQGFMPTQYLRWFAEHAARCNSIVEVGCWRGRTTRVLSDNCPGTVTAVDTWEGCEGINEELEYMRDISGDHDWLYHEFMRNVGCKENVEVRRMPSLDAAAIFRSQGRMFDLVFIDASHDYNSVMYDLQAWSPLVSWGGILCGHDYKFPDVQRAVREMFPFMKAASDADLWVIEAPQEKILVA